MTRPQHRIAFLLALAALGAAGMFLGPDGWLGMDIGPIGASVLYAAMWLIVIHLARHSDAVFPEDASFHERQAWVGLGFTLLIAMHFVNFLAAMIHMGDGAERLWNPASRAFSSNLGILIVGWIVASGILRAQLRDEVAMDERDLRVVHAAGRFANGLMLLQMILIVVALVAWQEESRAWMRPLLVANAFIALMIGHALAENVFAVWKYRRARV